MEASVATWLIELIRTSVKLRRWKIPFRTSALTAVPRISLIHTAYKTQLAESYPTNFVTVVRAIFDFYQWLDWRAGWQRKYIWKILKKSEERKNEENSVFLKNIEEILESKHWITHSDHSEPTISSLKYGICYDWPYSMKFDHLDHEMSPIHPKSVISVTVIFEVHCMMFDSKSDHWEKCVT